MNAVSSIVSVPCVTTRPSTSGRSSHAAAREAMRHMCSGVTCGPGRRPNSSISKSVMCGRSGTCAMMSSAERAGTAEPVAGSIRMEIVPPVKRMPIIDGLV